MRILESLAQETYFQPWEQNKDWLKWGNNFKVNNETNAVKTSKLCNIFLKMYELKSLTIINEYIVHALTKFEMHLSETAIHKELWTKCLSIW